MKPGLIQEQDGATSSRRFLAVVSYLNAIALSWAGRPWETVLIFAGATMVLLGLTTVADLQSLRFADSGKTMEQSGNSERLEQSGNSERLEQ